MRTLGPSCSSLPTEAGPQGALPSSLCRRPTSHTTSADVWHTATSAKGEKRRVKVVEAQPKAHAFPPKTEPLHWEHISCETGLGWTLVRGNSNVIKAFYLSNHFTVGPQCSQLNTFNRNHAVKGFGIVNTADTTLKNWCFWTVVLEKTLESPLDCKIKPVNPKGNQSWGWDGCMASLTWWTWVWASSESWWWTGKPGVLQSMGSQSQTWLEWLNWTEH